MKTAIELKTERYSTIIHLYFEPYCAFEKPRHNFLGKIGTPAAVEAMDTPSPMAANVPHTLARKTTTPIAHLLERLVFL